MCALNMLLDLKDLRTGLHATRLAEWAVRVGELLGLEESDLRDIEAASLLHDIGKIGLPDSILLKPGKLSSEEYAITKKHPEYGWAILRSIPGFERTSLLVLHHHERYDGKGYPAGLAGEDIPLGSRIVAVVDSFDAMLSSRAYRSALPVEEAVRRLVTDIGSQFDPKIAPLFIELAREQLDELVEGADDLPVGLARILP
jgi:HD-GYP domain-containing protein (c-di-GMP phosphodiesterase class II)